MRNGILALALAAAGLLGACADQIVAHDIGSPFTLDLVPFVQAGQTSRGETESWFGQPTSRVTYEGFGPEHPRARDAYLYATEEPGGYTVLRYLQLEFDGNGQVLEVAAVEDEQEPSYD